MHSRPRLASSILIGAITALAIPAHWTPVSRALTGWNVTIWTYLFLMGWLMTRASHARVRTIAQQEDKSAVVVLAIMSLAAIASLAAIVLELTSVKDLSVSRRLAHYAFGRTLCIPL